MKLTAVGAVEVVVEDRAEIRGGRRRRGGRVRRGGHRGGRRGVLVVLSDAAESDLMLQVPLQGHRVALQGARGRRSHGPEPRGLQGVRGLPGLETKNHKLKGKKPQNKTTHWQEALNNL